MQLEALEISSALEIWKNKQIKALALFSDENAKSVVFLKSLEDYLNGYIDDKGKKHKGYLELLKELQAKFPLTNFLESTLTETQKKDFLTIFGKF